MMTEFNNDVDGSVTAAGAEASSDGQDANGEGKVNPGAIRKSTTHGILNALSHASGQQFDSVEAAIAYMARTSNAPREPVGNVKPVASAKTRSDRVSTTDLQEQFARLQEDLARKEQTIRERDLDSDIRQAMGERFDPDLLDYALTKVKSNIQWNDDGTYSIVNTRGQERYGMSGTPLTITDLVQEVAKGNPKLLRQSNLSGGSGLRPSGGMFAGAPEDSIPDYSKDPAAFNAWAQRNGLGKNIGLKATTVSATVTSAGRKIL
jgi:hypothetical protein